MYTGTNTHEYMPDCMRERNDAIRFEKQNACDKEGATNC